MKLVKDINKMILVKVIEIAFIIVFMIVATNLYSSERAQEVFRSIAAYSDVYNTHLAIKNQINYSMFPMTDERAMEKLIPCTLTVSNETYKTENYTLVLKINKSSTLNYSYLHISINNDIYALEALEKQVTDDEIIFILDEGSLTGESKEYNVRLWLNTLAENDMQGKNLIMQFDLLNETITL